MKRGSTLFLKGVVFLIAIIVLVLCIVVLPAGIISDKTDYYRPLLVGMYIPAIPFFFALYQGWKLLNYIDRNIAFSAQSIKALNNIKYCAIAIGTLYTLGMPYIFYVADLDDAPGVAALGFVIIFASFVIGTFAAVLQKLIQSAVDIKSENDLTI